MFKKRHFPTNRSPVQTLPELEFSVESLECRRMLAADVTLSGGTLKISSDGASDGVQITGTSIVGQVRVVTDNTIEATYRGVESIRVNMRDGNDLLLLGAINISGDVKIKMGNGTDELRVSNRAGDDDVDGDVVLDDMKVSMGGNAGDKVEWETNGDHSIFVGGNLSIKGAADLDLNGKGGEPIVQDRDINIGGRLSIRLTPFGDANFDGRNLEIDDVNVTGKTSIQSSSADDYVEVRDGRFLGRVRFKLGDGDDILDVPSAPGTLSYFESKVIFDGGNGDGDILAVTPSSFFLPEFKIKNFETVVEDLP